MATSNNQPDPRDLSLEEILARPCPKPTFPEQNEDGVDLSLIEANLRLTPAQRVLAMEQHADEVRELNRIGKRNPTKPLRSTG